MSGAKAKSGVDNTHRKIWDKAEFHERAKEREIEVRLLCLVFLEIEQLLIK